MARVATTLLFTLLLANVAYGDLLRPCECGPGNPYSCGMCPGDRAHATRDDAPC